MNANEQVELHYMDNGYSYPISEGYVDLFGGAPTAPLDYFNMDQMHDQESMYWSMNMNSYKYGQSSSDGTYYGVYENNELAPRMDFNRRVWEYSSMTTAEDSITVGIPSQQTTVTAVHSIPEEREPNDQDAPTPQESWQDDIDPDTMTYEELLDLGEAVGTQNRGLSQELINLLPTSKHKSGGIFSRKKSMDRCVICQMRYKRGERQINLPCKHAYHINCGSKWLSISKTCPVCNCVVFGDDDQHKNLTN